MVRLEVIGILGEYGILGETETVADPFHPAAERAIEWLVETTHVDAERVWGAIWTAWARSVAA